MRAVRNVQWQRTHTELEAILLESRHIKGYKPRFNKVSSEYRPRSFLRLGWIAGAPWITVVHYVRNDGARYYGPFASRREAETVAEILVRLYGASPSAFKKPERLAGVGLTAARIGGRLSEPGVEHVQTFLSGEGVHVQDALECRMQRASSTQEYERASRYRDWQKLIVELSVGRYFSGRSVLERHGAALIVRDKVTEIHLFAFGCPVITVVMPKDAPLLRKCVHKLVTIAATPPEILPRDHVDGIALFGQWVRKEFEQIQMVLLTQGMNAEHFEQDIRNNSGV